MYEDEYRAWLQKTQGGGALASLLDEDEFDLEEEDLNDNLFQQNTTSRNTPRQKKKRQQNKLLVQQQQQQQMNTANQQQQFLPQQGMYGQQQQSQVLLEKGEILLVLQIWVKLFFFVQMVVWRFNKNCLTKFDLIKLFVLSHFLFLGVI